VTYTTQWKIRYRIEYQVRWKVRVRKYCRMCVNSIQTSTMSQRIAWVIFWSHFRERRTCSDHYSSNGIKLCTSVKVEQWSQYHPSILIRSIRGRVAGAADPAGWPRLPSHPQHVSAHSGGKYYINYALIISWSLKVDAYIFHVWANSGDARFPEKICLG